MKSQRIPIRTTAWLLAALVVVGVCAPPAVQHAHSGGETPHSHQHHDMVHHHHGHSHPEDGNDLAAPVAHIHVQLLGYEWTLPTSTNVPASDQSDRIEHPVALHILADCVPTRAEVAPGLAFLVTPAPPDIAAHWVTPRRSIPALTSPSVLLCDSARLEQTGVRRC